MDELIIEKEKLEKRRDEILNRSEMFGCNDFMTGELQRVLNRLHEINTRMKE